MVFFSFMILYIDNNKIKIYVLIIYFNNILEKNKPCILNYNVKVRIDGLL